MVEWDIRISSGPKMWEVPLRVFGTVANNFVVTRKIVVHYDCC